MVAQRNVIGKPRVMQSLTIEFSCRKDKLEKNFILPEVDIDGIQSIEDLKFYLMHNLPVLEVGGIGYILKGRKKVWLRTDGELQMLIASTGKGALWCDVLMKSTGKDDNTNPTEKNQQ